MKGFLPKCTVFKSRVVIGPSDMLFAGFECVHFSAQTFYRPGADKGLNNISNLCTGWATADSAQAHYTSWVEMNG